MRTESILLCAVLAVLSTAGRAFEKIAIVDNFDFARVFDTETVKGTEQTLDHVLLTGADTVLWRPCSGGTMRYLSEEEPSVQMAAPLDPRRVPESRAVYGWLRYWRVRPDIIRTVFDSCARRAVRQGIHWPYEENHWNYWTLGAWNLEHPQYWCRNVDGVPWHGRCSFAFPEVLEHKMRILDELLDRKPETLFFDLFRCGMWSVADEYVEPHLELWRARHGGTPPADSTDPRWLAIVGETQEAFFRAVRARIASRGLSVRVLLGIDGVTASGADENWTYRAVDWKKLVRENVVDGIVIESVRPDPARPYASTLAIYRSVAAAMGGKPFFCPIMQYNFGHGTRPGYPWYARQTGDRPETAVRKLLELARDAGAAGIAMECVDHRNYSPAVCETIKRFEGMTQQKGPQK
jgi:hypothetical protein